MEMIKKVGEREPDTGKCANSLGGSWGRGGIWIPTFLPR